MAFSKEFDSRGGSTFLKINTSNRIVIGFFLELKRFGKGIAEIHSKTNKGEGGEWGRKFGDLNEQTIVFGPINQRKRGG